MMHIVIPYAEAWTIGVYQSLQTLIVHSEHR